MGEQLTMETLETLETLETEESEKNTDYFGCCGLYRKCSEEKRCVDPDIEHAKMCRYKASLDAGNIFYGKNSKNFQEHKEDYNYLVDYFEKLPAEEKEIFEEIIIDVCFTNRAAADHLCFYDEKVHKVLSNCRLFTIFSAQELIEKLYRAEIINLTSAKAIHGHFSTLSAPEKRIFQISKS